MDDLKQEKKYKIIVIIIMVLAILVRIFFITFSTIEQYQYDVGVYHLKNSDDYDKIFQKDERVLLKYRHLDYILTIYETGKLPLVNNNEFYHPPLYHIISAIWLKLMDLTPFSAQLQLESLQIVTCVYSILILIIIIKILDELNIKNIYKMIALSICAFHPLFIYMAGLINNDTLLTMFSVLSILYIIRWYKDSSYKNAILLAMIIGFGTLVKSSMLVNLVVVGITFFIKLLDMLYQQNYKIIKSFVLQAILFFIIVLPLAFSFPIRNYELFGQDLFSIHDADKSLYVGNDNPIERFGIFNKEMLVNEIGQKDRNVLSYAIKSAIIFKVDMEAIRGTTFVRFLSILLIGMTIISIIRLLFSRNRQNWILISTYIIWIVSFIMFNIQMPNSCSMHARYITTSMIISIILLAQFLQQTKHQKITPIVVFLSGLFCLSSVWIVIQNVL